MQTTYEIFDRLCELVNEMNRNTNENDRHVEKLLDLELEPKSKINNRKAELRRSVYPVVVNCLELRNCFSLVKEIELIYKLRSTISGK